MTFLKGFVKEEAGQDMIEYSLLLGFVAFAAVALYNTVSGSITTIWQQTGVTLGTAADNATQAAS